MLRTQMTVDGPEQHPVTGAHCYTVHGEYRDVHFEVVKGCVHRDQPGWDVCIEGLPDPPIYHEEPWQSPEAARDAALRAIEHILELERVQRAEEDARLAKQQTS